MRSMNKVGKNMSTYVHVKQSFLITPSMPTPLCTLPLSAIDSQLFLRSTSKCLLLFTPRHRPLDSVAVTHNLRTALAQILVPYYPLAGRVRRRANGPGLEVVCHAQGALFIDAISDSTVSEFDSALSCSADRSDFLAIHVEDVLIGEPPLVIQLTWLQDGAVALAIATNHCLCDGIGIGEFLNSFAELAVGKRGGLSELHPKPIWNRCLLDPSPSSLPCGYNPLSHHPEFCAVPDISQLSARFARETLTPTCSIFDKAKLHELKNQAKPIHTTSFDILAAHVWRSWARALNLSADQIVKLVFIVNIRGRVTPSLPNGYYGNAMVLGCAQACVGELARNGLRFAAEVVVRAKERVDDKYVREVVDAVSRIGTNVHSVGTLIMTQWSRLGLEKMDFGMGTPIQVGPICCKKRCVLLPVRDPADSVNVNIDIPVSSVDEFLCLLRNTHAS